MDYFFLLNYRVLRREFGKNTEVASENVFGVVLPSEKGRLKASPVLPFFPAQVQPLGCAVMSRECASWTYCIHLPPLTRPAGTSLLLSSGQACSVGRHSLALRTSRVTGGPGLKGKTFFSPIYIFFWGAQLSAAAAAANSVCGSDTRVKNPQSNYLGLHQGPLWTCLPAAPLKCCQRQRSWSLRKCKARGLLHPWFFPW